METDQVIASEQPVAGSVAADLAASVDFQALAAQMDQKKELAEVRAIHEIFRSFPFGL